MKTIFENEDIVVTDTEASSLIIRHKKFAGQIMVTSGENFIRASTHSSVRKVEAKGMTSLIEVSLDW